MKTLETEQTPTENKVAAQPDAPNILFKHVDPATALRMLDSLDEYDEEEQRETLEYLKRVLDEDRLSDRKLFS